MPRKTSATKYQPSEHDIQEKGEDDEETRSVNSIPTNKEIIENMVSQNIPLTEMERFKRWYIKHCITPKYIGENLKRRSPMGDYIPPEGGKPLSNLANPSVGPANYTVASPSLTKLEHYPQWSMPGRSTYNYNAGRSPAPNAYDPRPMKCRKAFTLSGRARPAKDKGWCKRGPTYYPKHCRCKMDYSFPKAGRHKPVGGYPDPLCIPTLTPGFSTPGAELVPMEGVRPHSFHANFTSLPAFKPSDLPGPAEYEKPLMEPGLAKSFGRRYKQVIKYTPAPNIYKIPSGTCDGPKYSFRRLPKPPEYVEAPAPCSYMKEREYSHKEKIRMHERFPSPTPDGHYPGPRTYDLTYYTQKQKLTPYATIKSRTKPSYPNTIFNAETFDRAPGPGTYNLAKDFEPKITIKRRYKYPIEKIPGPTDHGRVEVAPLSDKKRAPAHSMSGPYKPKKESGTPGPAAYHLTPLEPGLMPSMKARPLEAKKAIFPGPNEYKPKCTRFGPQCILFRCSPSMSSRHSPFRYYGMKINI